MFSIKSCVSPSKNSGTPPMTSSTMSCCTAFGSDFHTNGASAFMMSLKMVYVLAFTAGARTSAKSCGTILPNISATSISFVVIKSVRMPAIFPALLGMIPCHPPSAPNGCPLSCANFKNPGKNSSG